MTPPEGDLRRGRWIKGLAGECQALQNAIPISLKGDSPDVLSKARFTTPAIIRHQP
jgi:hypothetical protein